MHNKVLKNTQKKPKKDKNSSKKDLENYNPLLLNSNNSSKNNSKELDGKNHLNNLAIKNNCIQQNKPNQNTAIINTIKHMSEFSGKKKNNKTCSISNTTLNQQKLYNNNPEKLFKPKVLVNSDKNIPIIKDTLNIINNNVIKKNKEKKTFGKSDMELMKINVKKNVLNLSEFDSKPVFDSIEEDKTDQEKKGGKTKLKNEKVKNDFDINERKKTNPNSFKRRFTITEINKINKLMNNNSINNILNEKEKEHHNKKNESFDDFILNDTELNDSKKFVINNLEINNFPELSKNPFITESNLRNENNDRFQIYSNKSRKNEDLKHKLTDRDKKLNVDNNFKSSTFGTTNKTFTTNPNSSNISSTTEIINNNINSQNVNSFKKDSKNDVSLSENEQNYKNLLLLTKNGETEQFLDLFDKISVLQNFSTDINYKDENGFTALHYSSDEGNLKIVEKLLNSNCNPNIKNNKNETPLHLASKKGFFEICKALIDNGALLNIYDSEQNSPIHYVCINNNKKILELFLSKNPHIDSKNKNGKMPIDLATNKEIKNLLENYLNKNKNKAYETNRLFEKKCSKGSNITEKVKNPQKEKKELDLHVIDIKRSKTLRSPSFKNIRNNLVKTKNNANNEHESEHEIKKKNTLLIKSTDTFNLKKNSSNISLNTSNNKMSNNNINSSKTNSNSIFTNNNSSKNSKIEENNNKNNEKKNNSKSKKIPNNENKNIHYILNENKNNHINNISVNNHNNINSLKQNNDSENLLNKPKKATPSDINNTKTNGIKPHNDCNTKINPKKISNSTNIFNKVTNINEKIIPNQNRTKNLKNNSKNKRKDESIPLSDKELITVNKTEENITKIPKRAKILKSIENKNNYNHDTTEKIVNKIKYKAIKKKEIKNEKGNHIDNSLINNCNVSKISCKQNKNNFKLDSSVNKSNVIDQTLQENIHQKLNLNSIEEERITPANFVCLAILGRGSFGEVYLVQHINNKEKYAMKVLRKERMLAQNLLKYAIAERNVLSLSHHPFIVKLNYAFQTSTKLFLLLEYCPNGDLGKHLLFEKRFSEQRAKFYICEVLLALENLHKRGIIFRDLKPDNVVLDDQGHCKLTDFGLSKEGVFEGKYAQSFCGSIAYLAPEMLKKQGHGKAVDWYLLGVLFYEMLVGVPPFFTTKKEEIFHNIECAELKIPNYVSTEVAELLRRLLERDPNKRLGGSAKDAQEIKEHPYFKDVDWNKVYNKEIKPPTFVNYMSKIVHMYHKPRQFANDDLFKNTLEKPNPNTVMGWSFINNEES